MSTAEEMEAGRKQTEYWANPGVRRSQEKPDPTGKSNDGAAGTAATAGANNEPADTCVSAFAAPAKEFQNLARKSQLKSDKVFQAEGGLDVNLDGLEVAKAPKVVPEVAVPVAARVTTPVANAGSVVDPAKNKTNMGVHDDVAQFIGRVVPSPEDGQTPGYINLHWTMVGRRSSELIWTGKPCRSVAEFISRVNWAKSLPTTRDIYYCLSLQSRTRTNERGKLTVARSQADALALKALWLDIDVKEPPKGYATIQEAWAALKDFYTAVGLPAPSALIASGGGLHVYWISKIPLTPDQWRPLAGGLKNAALKHGLRCDAGCTVDSARVLRVPGTWNCKTEPRRPVQLWWLGKDYDF